MNLRQRSRRDEVRGDGPFDCAQGEHNNPSLDRYLAASDASTVVGRPAEVRGLVLLPYGVAHR